MVDTTDQCSSVQELIVSIDWLLTCWSIMINRWTGVLQCKSWLRWSTNCQSCWLIMIDTINVNQRVFFRTTVDCISQLTVDHVDHNWYDRLVLFRARVDCVDRLTVIDHDRPIDSDHQLIVSISWLLIDNDQYNQPNWCSSEQELIVLINLLLFVSVDHDLYDLLVCLLLFLRPSYSPLMSWKNW